MPSRVPASDEVAAAIVEGMRNDERLGCVPDFDGELIRRIASVIDGERSLARHVFDFYNIPEPPS